MGAAASRDDYCRMVGALSMLTSAGDKEILEEGADKEDGRRVERWSGPLKWTLEMRINANWDLF